MADNYLENKMEEHRRNASAKKYRPRLTPTGQKAGHLYIKYPPKRVFVSGGASGIRKAIVKAFCNAGCQVAFCDIDAKNGNLTAQETGARFLHIDVADVQALEAGLQHIADTWGDIDIIINNAGTFSYTPLTDCTVEQFDKTLAINLRPIFITARFLGRLRKSKQAANSYGRIINISSTRAIMSESGTEPYSASKGGITALTHALTASLSEFSITVNCISPGWIHTGKPQELRPEDHLQHPSKRVGNPDDIARACLWLSMEENGFINGENIVIDGGMTRKMQYI